MRRAAIIGSGIAGLLTAHGLRKGGFEVTVYSDRSGEDWLQRYPPTGAAARFHPTLAYDRELGLDHWPQAPGMDGVSLAFGLKPKQRLLTLTSRFPNPGRAIDVRLMSARWMKDLEERGGKVVVESVTVPRLDEIAAQHDLTIVAAGRKELCALFPRNAERSVFDAPQRKVTMVITRGASMALEGAPFTPVRFNLFGGIGEAFWVPYWHKDHGATWVLGWEALPGSPMDKFDGVKSGEEAVARSKQLIRELSPWDAAWAEPMELADPNGWLMGGVTPTVREPVGRLPSGRVVTAVGDTITALDPVGGQGANCGTRNARHLVQAALERGDRPFDAEWMAATFEAFWQREGRHIIRFNNALLQPLSVAGRMLMFSQYGSDGVRNTVQQRIADAFAANFDNSSTANTDALMDPAVAKQVIAGAGGSWPWTLVGGALNVVRAQARSAIGLSPQHPSHPWWPGAERR